VGNSGHFVYLNMAALLLGVQEGLGVLDNVLADSDKVGKIKVFFCCRKHTFAFSRMPLFSWLISFRGNWTYGQTCIYSNINFPPILLVTLSSAHAIGPFCGCPKSLQLGKSGA
jgi:hypothetical protein